MTRTKLEIFCSNTFLPVYNLAQNCGGGQGDPLMYLLGDGHLILRGIWKFFLEINILARSWPYPVKFFMRVR
jgi:hypothetical protein